MIRLRPSGVDEILIKRVQDWYEPGPGVFITSTSTLFSPAMLFTGTTNGAWYDPSDTTTLYRDAAGTLPVTAVEQPVGLMLDKSKGLVLGPELVTNGDFSQGTTGWTLPINATVITESSFSGRLSVLKSVNNSTLGVTTTQSFSVVSGRAYEVSCYAYAPSSNSGVNAARLVVTGGISPAQNTSDGYVTTEDSWQFIKFVVFASAATITVGVNSSKSGAVITSGDIAYFDNISVRELPGNHAFNSSGNSANFPVLSARYNLLTKTEDFSDVVWFKSGTTITPNTTVAPDGTLTADAVFETNTNDFHVLEWRGNQSTSQVSDNYTFSVAVKANGRASVRISAYQNLSPYPDINATFNLLDGSYATGNSGSGVFVSASSTNLGNGWYRCTITGRTGQATINNFQLTYSSNSYQGDPTKGLYIWGADLRVANDALNQPAYQRVNTSTDYDTVGFKPYLRFNGTNQWLQTNSIDFTYGDKMFVSAGVRKLSDAAAGIPVELGTNGYNTGNFAIFNSDAGSTYSFVTDGSFYRPSGYSAPISNVLSMQLDKSETTIDTEIIPRINGVLAQSNPTGTGSGAGNFSNSPLYIGARAGSSLWFNGRLYQMVVAGKQASAAEITSTETYINQKTGAF